MTEKELKWVNDTICWCKHTSCRWDPRYLYLFNGDEISTLIQMNIPGIGSIVLRVTEGRIGPLLEVSIKSGNKYEKIDNEIVAVKLLKVRKMIDEFKQYVDVYLEHCERALREYLKLNENSNLVKEQLNQLSQKFPEFGQLIDKIDRDYLDDGTQRNSPVIRTSEEFAAINVTFSAGIRRDETDMCETVKKIVNVFKSNGIIVQADPCEWFFAHFRSQIKQPTVPEKPHDEHAYIHFRIVSF